MGGCFYRSVSNDEVNFDNIQTSSTEVEYPALSEFSDEEWDDPHVPFLSKPRDEEWDSICDMADNKHPFLSCQCKGCIALRSALSLGIARSCECGFCIACASAGSDFNHIMSKYVPWH